MTTSYYYPVTIFTSDDTVISERISIDMPAIDLYNTRSKEKDRTFLFTGSVKNQADFINYVYSKKNSRSKDCMIIQGNGSHSCRETLLYVLRSMYRIMSENSMGFGSARTFIKLMNEDGIPMRESKRKKVVAFAEKFLHNRISSVIHIKEETDGLILSAKIPFYSHNRELYRISLILYMIRYDEIIDALMSRFRAEEKPEISDMYLFLSEEFLKHESWGNSANVNVNLSMFCYGIAKGGYIDQSSFTNGPSNAGIKFLEVKHKIGYVRDILLSVFPENFYACPGVEHMSSADKDEILMLSDLIKKSKAPEKVQKKSSTQVLVDLEEQESRLFTAIENRKPIPVQVEWEDDEDLNDDEEDEENW